jgi:hypothetical protein
MRQTVVRIAVRLFRVVRANSALRRRLAAFKDMRLVRAIYWRFDSLSKMHDQPVYALSDLSPRAQAIYRRLKTPTDSGEAR